MDEVGFGPAREDRRPSRRLRAIAAAVSVAGAAAAGIALALTAAGAHHAITAPPAVRSAALPVPVIRPPSAVCPPGLAKWPNLAGLPAGLRAGALPIVIDEQFSGRCPVP
ncbi:MAG: hypothetical protein ABSA02_01375 [Trebonia sp.]|jgi:hypothetical protein